MDTKSKVEYLIVDTSAFIKNAALQDIGNKIITESGVINEIKSKRQLKRLVVLPYDLEVKEAYPEDIKFVSEFSKKTGDYTSLSATDIKVIALTYRYERERVGTDHLKKEPEKKKEIVDSSIKRPEDYNNLPMGFYVPNANKNVKKDDYESSSQDDESFESESSDDDNEKLSDKNEDNLNEKFGKLSCNPEDLKLDCEDNVTVDDILKPVKNNSSSTSDESIHNSENEDDDDEDDEDDDEEDDTWITPKNIKDHKKKMISGLVKDKPATVACLTMDYAMQNVLMQIGLNIASLEGKVIKQMRTFILRCYSCFKTTPLVTKVFCPNCGYKTLKKVAVSLDDEGKEIIHINFKKPLTARGQKFSLPTFQGGKHACNPILCEDQPLPDQRPTKLGRTKTDPLNDDYIAGMSPFVMRDVNSKAAMLGIKPGSSLKYWMRRNPNEVRKRRK